MFYRDPMAVTCPSCGHESACKVGDLFALQARCAACGIVLEDLGRTMRRGSNRSRTLSIKLETVIELEAWLGQDIEINDSPDDATVRDFIAAVAGSTGRDRDDRELVDRVIEAMAKLAERPLSIADLDRSGLTLFAIYPEGLPAAPRATGNHPAG
jgi:hypothetical protein